MQSPQPPEDRSNDYNLMYCLYWLSLFLDVEKGKTVTEVSLKPKGRIIEWHHFS
jgi:uncharacterized membrane protein YobD (UPF0266 family)